MRKRLTGAGHTVHALRDVGTTPVSAIMRAATFCDPDEPLRQAAGGWAQDATSALLVRLGERRLGIVTDADVRASVAGGDVSLDAPVQGDRAHARCRPCRRAQLAVEAAVDMVAAGRRAPRGDRRRRGVRDRCRRPTCSGSTRAARSRCGT